jgi:hypothetical protein
MSGEGVVTASLTLDRGRAFALFCDAKHLPTWVPGLRRAIVVREGDPGFPKEVKYEFAESRSYSLVYEYDRIAHVVRWTPNVGVRDAVRGEARFEARDGGSTIWYWQEFGAARAPKEKELGDAERLVAAFVAFAQAVK